jgi:superfamily II DNA or RNA helicase
VDLEGFVVGFSGSANFTLGGLFNNLEEINIFLSSSPDSAIQKKLSNQKDHFNRIMARAEDEIEYLSPCELQEAILSSFGGQDIEDLLNVEHKLKAYKKSLKPKSVVQEGDDSLPEFPYSSGPRDYQKQAFEKWKKNSQKGLFAMATGTGKTITSLNCLLEINNRCGYYMAIILVPTITLVNQWEDECRKFKFSRIIKVFSKNPKWKERIELISMEEKMRKENEKPKSFIIISTYASFTREAVFEMLNSFDRRKVLLIADEAHNMGSPQILKKLDMIVYLRRIGLSATPERQYEPEINDKIFSFFGAKEQYTFEYSMEEAIKNGVLCKYYYYPHMVRLTETEMEEYIDLSVKISKYFNYYKECFDKQDEVLKRLLLARKRIIHKAQNKVGAFRAIMEDRFKEKGDLKYSLVYVPEGSKPDYIEDSDIFDKHEQIEDDAVSDHLIDVFTQIVSEIDKYVTVKRFVSGQADRDYVLRDFASGKLQVLTSMKCLDEGVDVPRSEMAVFCASTGNPRQFIQRRGRVLRTHPDKHMAILHDLVVIPEVGSTCDSFKMEQILLRNELIRVNNFSMLSENPSYSQIELGPVMRHYGLNLYNNDHI